MLFKSKKLILYATMIAAMLTALCLLPMQKHLQTSSKPLSATLVIDAGHGGADGGAVASNGTLESEINLDIALRLEALADFWGISTVMTRAASEIEYPESAETLSAKKKADQDARIDLIQNTPGAVLISIHQNYYPSTAPWGIQVFFGSVSGSSQLAELTQMNLTCQLAPENRRLASAIDENIYLMRKITCPAILVECGFLSNETEREKLETENYRLELAAVMLASFQQYTEGIRR